MWFYLIFLVLKYDNTKATIKIAYIIKTIKMFMLPVSGNVFIAKDAGKTYDTYCRNVGNISTGNIEPDKITEGKNTACPSNVMVDGFLENTPIIRPIPSLASIKPTNEIMKANTLVGSSAS